MIIDNSFFLQGKLKPRVIIPVDLFGLPANYKKISKLADKYNLLILEDAAQGLGGSIEDKKACSFAKAATTSFYKISHEIVMF